MVLLLAMLPAIQIERPPADFSREVRPILAEHCFACHGPDAAARKADLRLDIEGDVIRDRGGYSVIDRVVTEDSELLLRLHGDGVLERMPPESEEPLSDEERDVLQRWVAEGAPWGDHWAFRAPTRPTVPAGSAWSASPIDALVHARLAVARTPASTPRPRRFSRH